MVLNISKDPVFVPSQLCNWLNVSDLTTVKSWLKGLPNALKCVLENCHANLKKKKKKKSLCLVSLCSSFWDFTPPCACLLFSCGTILVRPAASPFILCPRFFLVSFLRPTKCGFLNCWP